MLLRRSGDHSERTGVINRRNAESKFQKELEKKYSTGQHVRLYDKEAVVENEGSTLSNQYESKVCTTSDPTGVF